MFVDCREKENVHIQNILQRAPQIKGVDESNSRQMTPASFHAIRKLSARLFYKCAALGTYNISAHGFMRKTNLDIRRFICFHRKVHQRQYDIDIHSTFQAKHLTF